MGESLEQEARYHETRLSYRKREFEDRIRNGRISLGIDLVKAVGTPLLTVGGGVLLTAVMRSQLPQNHDIAYLVSGMSTGVWGLTYGRKVFEYVNRNFGFAKASMRYVRDQQRKLRELESGLYDKV